MPSEAVTNVLTRLINDGELRTKLNGETDDAARRALAEEAGLFDGLTEADEAELHRLAHEPDALSDQMLESVTGGTNQSAAGDYVGPGYIAPTTNAGGATIAGDVVVAGSSMVVGAGTAVATTTAVVGSLAVFFC